MTALDQSPEIVRLANTLGIHQHPHPAEAIVEYCLKKVSDWLAEFDAGTVESLAKVEQIVCAKLRLKFEYIENDDDVARIENIYTDKGEFVIKNLLEQLDSKTYGAVFERKKITKKDRDKYVAVIDCRGDKRARKFFTKWHEIAHLLTLKTQLEFVLFRDTGVKKPEEQMMDLIAARVGFYPPIFSRDFEAEYHAYGRVSFGLVQRVRDNVCAEASYESCLHACFEKIALPCLLLRVDMGLSEAEKRKASQPSLFPDDGPIEVLRAVSVKQNSSAREAKLTIHRNMRVPANSCIYSAFQQLNESYRPSDEGVVEDMQLWEHSDGTTMVPRKVTVHTRRHGKSLLALIVAEGD